MIFVFLLFTASSVFSQWIQGPCSSEPQIKRNEGYTTTVSPVNGISHVCYGFNLEQAGAATTLASVGAPSKSSILAGTPVSQADCQALLEYEMEIASSCAAEYVSNFNSLTLSQQSALVDMAYNLGCAGLGKFVNLQAAVVRRDFVTAANEIQNSNYCSQVGCRCKANMLCMNNCYSFPSSCNSRYPTGVDSCGGNNPSPTFAPTPYPVSCTYSSWSNSGKCDALCGETGDQLQVRTASSASCTGATTQYVTCYGLPCTSQPTPSPAVIPACTYSQWSPVPNSCNAPCDGIGTRQLTRDILSGSNCRDPLTSSETCYGVVCPVTCTYTAWSQTTPCDKQCGTGQMTERRTASSSSCTESTLRYSSCTGTNCALDCRYSEWFPISGCLGACGKTGIRAESRTSNDYRCTVLSQSVQCVVDACPDECVYTAWRTTTPCNAACDQKGQLEQNRMVNNPTLCKLPLVQQLACSGRRCDDPNPGTPVNCQWAPWGTWGTCSVACGNGGMRSRSRTFMTLPAFGGAGCDGQPFESQSCSAPACEVGCTPKDCVLADWSAWTSCTVIAAKKRGLCEGSQSRERRIGQPAQCGGAACAGVREDRPCDAPECLGQPGYVPIGPYPDDGGQVGPGGKPTYSPTQYNGLTGPNGKPLPPGYSYDANKNVVDARGNVVGFDKDGNPVPLDTTDAFAVSSDGALPVAAIAGIAAGAGLCCLFIIGLVICMVVALASSSKTKQSADAYQPTKEALVENNPLFANQVNKAYNPIFYPPSESRGALVTAPNSGNYPSPGMGNTGTIGAGASAYPQGSSYGAGSSPDAMLSAREDPMASAIYSPGGYAAENTCVICNQAYPTAKDLDFHVQKRHGTGAGANASYPSASQSNYPSAQNYGGVNAANTEGLYVVKVLNQTPQAGTSYPSGSANYPSGASSSSAFVAGGAGTNYPSAQSNYPSDARGSAMSYGAPTAPGATLAFSCSECGKNYQTEADLAQHRLLRHTSS